MSVGAIKLVLLVEDNPGDARLLRIMFDEHGSHETVLMHVESVAALEQCLVGRVADVILLDLGLPDAQGLDAMRRAHALAPDVALVVLTGLDDEALASRALQEGAQDYLVKGQIDPRGLLRAMRYAVERKCMETAAQAMAIKMVHSAEHDFLTGLPNRVLLSDRIDRAIALAPRHLNKTAILFLDLDGFKHINDSLGHSIGDKLLQSIATGLVGCVRSSDTVSRQGGDEFVALLAEIEHAEDAAITARRMLQTVAEVHSIDQHDLHVTASIGISVYPDDGLDPETLIKNADTAMYQAKAQGRQSYQFFKQEMNARAVERQSIEESLRRAIDREELTLHYQPKVSLATRAMTGAEALIRWNHPERGLIFPLEFVPVAEDSGLIVPIGRWVLREACRQAIEWRSRGLGIVPIAVNVSAVEFRGAGFLDGIRKFVAESAADTPSLELELTESVLMTDTEIAAAALRVLTDLGVGLTLDDFGTGYSSLSYLRRFPITTLKIDRSFVQELSNGADDRALVAAIIAMGRSLGQTVIAEGIETDAQLQVLRELGCDEGQGYYFSRPLPAKEFAGYLARARGHEQRQQGSDQAATLRRVNGAEA